jgi:hypothetical protein
VTRSSLSSNSAAETHSSDMAASSRGQVPVFTTVSQYFNKASAAAVERASDVRNDVRKSEKETDPNLHNA